MPSKSRNGNSASSKVTVSYSSIEVNSAGTQARITSPKMSFYSKSGWSDSTNRGRCRGGAVTDETLFTNKTLNGGTDTWNCTAAWVTLVFGNTISTSFIGEVAGVSFYENDNNSDYFGPSLSITYPRRLYTAPAAPGVTLTRTSDTTATIAITGNQNSTAADKYWRYIDWQLLTDNDSWVTMGTGLAGATTSIPVTGLSKNHQYVVQVRALNEDATGAWTVSGYIYTTPNDPTTASASASGANNVISWTTAATYRAGSEVQLSDNGGTSWLATIYDVPGATLSYNHASVDRTKAWKYRVRHYVVNSGVKLYSDWRETAVLLAAPDAPTTCVGGRNSDTQQTVTWVQVNPTDPTKPYTTQQVRFQVDDEVAAATTLPDQGAGVTSLVHTGTSKNHRYRYSVRAGNAGGYSEWSAWSPWVSTTPSDPTGVGAVKSGSNILTNWTNTAPYRTGTEVEHSAAAGAYAPEPSTPVGAAIVSYNDTDANPAQTHQYRIRHRIAGVPLAGGGTTTLVSAYVYTQLIQLLTEPNPPQVTLSRTVFDAATTPMTATVVHQPLDSTAQSDAEIRWKKTTDGAWTTEDLNLLTQKTWAAGALDNGFTYEVQARTKGEHPDFSDWSSSITFQTSTTPQASFASPADGSTITTSRLEVQLSYYDAEGTNASAWRLILKTDTLETLWDSGQLAGNTHLTPYTLPQTLQDQHGYVLEAQVRDGSGLWSPTASLSFIVDYAEPPLPEVTATWNADVASVTLTITNPTPIGGEASQVAQTVERLTEGQYILIGTNIPISGENGQVSFTDRIPPINEHVTYRVTVVSDIPSTTTVETTILTGLIMKPRVFINGGSEWHIQAQLRGKVSISEDEEREGVRHTFAGRKKATAFKGPAVGRTLNLSGVVSAQENDEVADVLKNWQAWNQVGVLDPPLCYRDTRGRRLFVDIGKVSNAQNYSPFAQITTSVYETDDGEVDDDGA